MVVMSSHRRTRSASTASEPDPEPEPDDAPATMTQEELSERTGVPARTIRYYQTKKLLQPPVKDDSDRRMARYGEDHAERLRLIGQLHDRGLKLPAIRELLESGNASARVAEWLGLDASLSGSWSTEEPRLLSTEEIQELLADTPIGTLGEFESAGLVSRRGSSWLASSPDLLELSAGLVGQGIDCHLVLEAGRILQEHLERASGKLMGLFEQALRDGFGDGADPGELLGPLRPIAGDAARLIFARELERAIGEVLANPKRLARR